MISDLQEIDIRMLNILMEDARTPLVDMSKSLGISRITATRIFNRLVETGAIRRFTVEADMGKEPYALIQLHGLNNVKREECVETMEMLDGTIQVIVPLEDVIKFSSEHVKNITIIKNITRNTLYRAKNLIHCDLCHAKIAGVPITVQKNGKIYYACCPNCEKDLNADKIL